MREYSLRSQLMQLKQTEATWENTWKRKNTLPALSSDCGGANFAPPLGVHVSGGDSDHTYLLWIKNSWFFSSVYISLFVVYCWGICVVWWWEEQTKASSYQRIRSLHSKLPQCVTITRFFWISRGLQKQWHPHHIII